MRVEDHGFRDCAFSATPRDGAGRASAAVVAVAGAVVIWVWWSADYYFSVQYLYRTKAASEIIRVFRYLFRLYEDRQVPSVPRTLDYVLE